MGSYIQVTTTVESREQAESIAREMVRQRLAACVQVTGPIVSVYRWQGAIEQAAEFLVQAKSRQDRFAAIEKFIKENHPYEVPELIAVPLAAVGAAYAEWLGAELD